MTVYVECPYITMDIAMEAGGEILGGNWVRFKDVPTYTSYPNRVCFQTKKKHPIRADWSRVIIVEDEEVEPCVGI